MQSRFQKKIKMNINLLFIFPYNFVVVCSHAKYFMYFFHLQHGTRCIFCEKKDQKFPVSHKGDLGVISVVVFVIMFLKYCEYLF